jgi:hypothetical protein
MPVQVRETYRVTDGRRRLVERIGTSSFSDRMDALLADGTLAVQVQATLV